MKTIVIKPKKDFSDKQIEVLEKLNTVFVDNLEEFKKLKLSDKEPKVVAVDPDCTNWSFSNEMIDRVNNLQGICLSTTAFDYIDLEYCKKKHITVTNIPEYAAISVAEYMISQALCIAKKFPLQYRNKNKGANDFSEDFKGMLLNGKTAGIIGLGNNGSRVANLCKAFGMKVYYWNRSLKKSEYTLKSLDFIFKNCDFIFITLAINDATKQLITDDLLNMMKKNAVLISGTGAELFNGELVLKKLRPVKSLEVHGKTKNQNLMLMLAMQ